MTLREAAQAMDAALKRGCHLEAGRGTDMAAEFYVAWDALEAALALPVPPATTAPEAKPAESAIGWVSTNALQRLRRKEGGIGVSERPAELSDGDVRVRITVDPAPVEPEETPR